MIVDVYPSSSSEWQPLESFTSTFEATNDDIGNVLFPKQPSSFVIKKALILYDLKYIIPLNSQAYGRLESLPISSLDSIIDWELPNKCTTTSIKSIIVLEIQKSMKDGRISKRLS